MNYDQIEKAADKYADDNFIESIVTEEPCPTAKAAFAKAFRDGADYALSHLWVSVEERLPEEEAMVTAHSPNGRIDALKYHDEEFIDELGQAHCVDYYIPIPQLNNEK